MTTPKNSTINRRSLINTMGAAAVAGLAVSASSASAQNQANAFSPKRHKLDVWMAELPGDHRIFIDTSDAKGGANALRYAFNIFNAHVEDYAGKNQDLAMILCLRHASTPYAFNDAMWAKYGEAFFKLTETADPATQEAPTINTFNTANYPGAITIDSLVARGIQYAVCNNATKLTARFVATEAGISQQEAYDELIANAIPNSHFVPAGVMAVTRAQEYGYSLLYSA